MFTLAIHVIISLLILEIFRRAVMEICYDTTQDTTDPLPFHNPRTDNLTTLTTATVLATEWTTGILDHERGRPRTRTHPRIRARNRRHASPYRQTDSNIRTRRRARLFTLPPIEFKIPRNASIALEEHEQVFESSSTSSPSSSDASTCFTGSSISSEASFPGIVTGTANVVVRRSASAPAIGRRRSSSAPAPATGSIDHLRLGRGVGISSKMSGPTSLPDLLRSRSLDSEYEIIGSEGGDSDELLD